MTMKTLGIITLVVVVAFAGGWYTGASGRTDLSLALTQSTIRSDVAEVRAAVLDARLSLTQANFGDARRSLQRAHTIAEQLQERVRDAGQADRVGALQTVMQQLVEADRLSGALDPAADRAAAEALRTLEASIPTTGQ